MARATLGPAPGDHLPQPLIGLLVAPEPVNASGHEGRGKGPSPGDGRGLAVVSTRQGSWRRPSPDDLARRLASSTRVHLAGSVALLDTESQSRDFLFSGEDCDALRFNSAQRAETKSIAATRNSGISAALRATTLAPSSLRRARAPRAHRRTADTPRSARASRSPTASGLRWRARRFRRVPTRIGARDPSRASRIYGPLRAGPFAVVWACETWEECGAAFAGIQNATNSATNRAIVVGWYDGVFESAAG